MLDALIGLLAAYSLISPAYASMPFVNGPSVVATLPTASLSPASSRFVARPPIKTRPESLGVETSARAVFVADVATGDILYVKRAHDVLPIASLTKLMTAMVVLSGDFDPSKTVTFTEDDFRGEGKGVFAPGDTITEGEAMRALLVGSVNVAANALARTTMGREAFVEAMNAKARDLHLVSPVFVDPTGVDTLNRANAADVAAMLTIALSQQVIADAAALPSVTITTAACKKVPIVSTNLLLTSFLNKDPYHILGAKTGSLPQAGFDMAQVTQNAEGHAVVAVILASPNHFSRYQDIKAITAWAFGAYRWE
ncbi:serine hydrolase [Patescibacteria group bacterium]|nr:serine hydrolase [Patescibacteria group bacterium]MBU1448364.1 serine hydrolase [Patescibacteria group bacterium]MBU2613447.1 serine hydrolase [Patescibacteria group bacterium]